MKRKDIRENVDSLISDKKLILQVLTNKWINIYIYNIYI